MSIATRNAAQPARVSDRPNVTILSGQLAALPALGYLDADHLKPLMQSPDYETCDPDCESSTEEMTANVTAPYSQSCWHLLSKVM